MIIVYFNLLHTRQPKISPMIWTGQLVNIEIIGKSEFPWTNTSQDSAA